MVLTPGEIVMGGALLSLVVGIGVHLFTRSSYVNCVSCAERHRGVDQRLQDAERRDSKQFSMIKALVVYTTEIPSDEKAKLLNERGGE